jgi:hypothetical protein
MGAEERSSSDGSEEVGQIGAVIGREFSYDLLEMPAARSPGKPSQVRR